MALFIEKMFEVMKVNPKYWTLYFSLMLQPSVLRLVQDKVERIYRTYIPMLSRYFESLGHEDPITDAYIFGALLDGIGFSFVADPENYPYEKIKNRLIQLYCS